MDAFRVGKKKRSEGVEREDSSNGFLLLTFSVMNRRHTRAGHQLPVLPLLVGWLGYRMINGVSTVISGNGIIHWLEWVGGCPFGYLQALNGRGFWVFLSHAFLALADLLENSPSFGIPHRFVIYEYACGGRMK